MPEQMNSFRVPLRGRLDPSSFAAWVRSAWPKSNVSTSFRTRPLSGAGSPAPEKSLAHPVELPIFADLHYLWLNHISPRWTGCDHTSVSFSHLGCLCHGLTVCSWGERCGMTGWGVLISVCWVWRSISQTFLDRGALWAVTFEGLRVHAVLRIVQADQLCLSQAETYFIVPA